MRLNDIKGQPNAVRLLKSNLRGKRIANSYLFSGPKGVGRALCAKAFIMSLMCENKSTDGGACGHCVTCMKIGALEHPDLNWIKPEKNKAIKVDQVREAKDRLSYKPYQAPVSVCVLEDAHLMTDESSNALLKVLEEPPGSGLLILITDKKELLLDTVISRCAEVRFQFLSLEDTADVITGSTDIDGKTASLLAYFSQGSPGRAIEMMEEDILSRKASLLGILGEIANEENPPCLIWHTEGRDDIMDDIEMLIMFFRDVTLGKEGLEELVLDKDVLTSQAYSFFKSYSLDKINLIVEKLVQTKIYLAGNVNPKLVAQNLPMILK
ncbi:MAG: DNA polymerase III subunit delta' [Candidatus Tantalella remota]|nr:DNA polymerase III subunit delta' [Candidatus Tantalella remota]